MVAAEEVKDDKGRVLCSADTPLTADLIERLGRMGVRFVTVKGRPVSFPWEKPLEEELEALEKRLEGVQHPFLLELKQGLKAFLQKEYQTSLEKQNAG